MKIIALLAIFVSCLFFGVIWTAAALFVGVVGFCIVAHCVDY